jgi:CheY-like chemotaxis protein
MRRLVSENIVMTFLPGAGLGRIKADAGYVGQVIMNLIVNARDAMPAGGSLSIATSNITLDEEAARAHPGAKPGEYVMLSVTDTGTGMTEQVKARLFEAFFTTKHKGKGTGLGLATCQTIVHESGGHIAVDSTFGIGTTFNIYFPRVEQPLGASVKRSHTGQLPSGTETLLIVEDDPSVRHLACTLLKHLGYEVLSAANGQEALRVVRERKDPPVRLVITDVIMPLMGGKVMAEWLQVSYPDLKILFTSGYNDEFIVEHGGTEPDIAFLPKPYTLGILAQKIREVLDGETPAAPGAEKGTPVANPSAS